MRVVAEKFKDFAQYCMHRSKRCCEYYETPIKRPRCLVNRCPVITLPLRGTGNDAVLKSGDTSGQV